MFVFMGMYPSQPLRLAVLEIVTIALPRADILQPLMGVALVKESSPTSDKMSRLSDPALGFSLHTTAVFWMLLTNSEAGGSAIASPCPKHVWAMKLWQDCSPSLPVLISLSQELMEERRLPASRTFSSRFSFGRGRNCVMLTSDTGAMLE
jgi:hypothetical protein